MTITLTAEQEKFIAERLEREGNSSPEAIVAEALKLAQAKEEYNRRLAELRHEINIGIQQIERGEVLDGREVFARLREKNRQRANIQQ